MFPTPPLITYSYAGFQEGQGDNSFPGTQIDADLANLSTAITATDTFIQNFSRSDGYLKNGIVTVESLSPSLNVGFTLRGAWAAGQHYVTADGVVYNGTFYRALVTHDAIAGNRPDLDPVTWQFLFSIASISGAMSAFTYDPQNKMADTFARANHTGVQAISTITNLQTALDTLTAAKLDLAGGIMTGAIQNASFTISASPTKKASIDTSLVTAGQNRAIRVPDMDTATGLWEPILNLDFVSQVTINQNGLAAYKEVRVNIEAYPVSTAGAFSVQLSADNGATAINSGYYFEGSYGVAGSSAGSAALFSNVSSFLLTQNSTVSVGASLSGILAEITLAAFNKTRSTKYKANGGFQAANISDALVALVHHGVQTSQTAMNAIRVNFSTAFTGTIIIEGIRG